MICVINNNRGKKKDPRGRSVKRQFMNEDI